MRFCVHVIPLLMGAVVALPSFADEVVASAAGGWFAVDDRAVKDTTWKGGAIFGGETELLLQSSPNAWGEVGGGSDATITWESTSGGCGTIAAATTAESAPWTPEARIETNTLTYVSGSVVKTARFAVVLHTETVGGIVWTFRVTNGESVIAGVPVDVAGCVTLPSSLGGMTVTGIADGAFSGCGKLTAVTILAGVTSIGQSAFGGCSNISSFVFEGSVAPNVGEGAFDGVMSPCIAYVKDGSTGWGVEIPGKWNGLDVVYGASHEVGGIGKINVVSEWRAAYGGGMSDAEFSAWLTNTAVNASLKNWECYVLGLDPTNAASKITLDAPQTQETDRIVVGSNVKVPSGCGFVVSNEVTFVGGGGGGHGVTALPGGFAIELNEGDPTGLYSVRVMILPEGTSVCRSEFDVEQTVGVLKGVSAKAKTAIAVPWDELSSDGGAVCVSNLVKTANLTAGDKLHVYDKAGRRYWTWELSDGLVWEPIATYVVGEDGQISKTSAGKPTVTTVPRGSAVWLERQDVTKPYYLYGQFNPDAVSTVIDAGTAAESMWNLVASPLLEPFDLADIPLSDGTSAGARNGDEIILSTESGPRTYTLKSGQWGYDVNTVEQRTMPDGTKIGVVRKSRNTSDTTIPVGAGFWYVSHGGNPVIVW